MPTTPDIVSVPYMIPRHAVKSKIGLTSTIARHENGVSAGGFITAVQPAARAAPSFLVIIAEGKFHGVKMELVAQIP